MPKPEIYWDRLSDNDIVRPGDIITYNGSPNVIGRDSVHVFTVTTDDIDKPVISFPFRSYWRLHFTTSTHGLPVNSLAKLK